MNNISTLINKSFRFVVLTKKRYNIDESHSLKYCTEVFHNAKEIYTHEKIKYPYLQKQQGIIYTSAILHGMCDTKYMDEFEGVKRVNNYMKDYMLPDDLQITTNIISNVSQSSVNKVCSPNLGEYQLAYQIVREAKLFTTYDLDRYIIFGMENKKLDYTDALNISTEIFNNSLLIYNEHNFVTDYSKQKAKYLHLKSIEKLKFLS